MGSGDWVYEAGEATPEGQVPEPDRSIPTLGIAHEVASLLRFLKENGDPRVKLSIGRFYARRLLGWDPMGKRNPPPWMVYALGGLPMPMTWWEHPFGRPKNAE